MVMTYVEQMAQNWDEAAAIRQAKPTR